jgi:hypothetical protein
MSEPLNLPKIVTYETKDEVSKRWLGFFNQKGKFLPVYFRADSREEIIEKATAFWESTANKEKRLLGTKEKSPDETTESTPEKPANGTGKRGHHFAGTMWVIHPKTKHAARIPAGEVDAYLKKGYVRGKTLKS